MSVSIWEFTIPHDCGYYVLAIPGDAKWHNTTVVRNHISMFFSVEPGADLRYRKFKVVSTNDLINDNSLGYCGTAFIEKHSTLSEDGMTVYSRRVRHIIEVPND